MTDTKQLKAGAVVQFTACVMPGAFETHVAEINLVTTTWEPRYTTDDWGREMRAGYEEVPAYEMVGWRGVYLAGQILRVVKPAPALRHQTQAERNLTTWTRAAGWGTPSPDAMRHARSLTLKPVLVSGSTWRVASQSGFGGYTVRVALDDEGQPEASCNCADAHAGNVCKHSLCVLREYERHRDTEIKRT